jgi:hypothetical protein
VAPGQVNGQGASHSNLLLSQFVKEEALPKFSGDMCEFDDFQWKMERHLETIEVAQGSKIPDKVKLLILEKSLPEHDKKWLHLLLRQGNNVTYQSFMAQLASRNGSMKETQARDKWNALNFRTAGKVSVTELFRFEVEFRQARQDLPTVSDEECYRHLLSKLPQHMANWVIEEEIRIRTTQPQLLIEMPDGYSEKALIDCAKKVSGETLTQVQRVRGNEFLVTFMCWANAKKMLELHGRKIRESPQAFKVQEMQPKFTVDQVFDLVKHKLEGRERGDHFLKTHFGTPRDRWRSPVRDPRYVRILEENDPPRQEGNQREISPPQKNGRGRSRSLSPRPITATKSRDTQSLSPKSQSPPPPIDPQFSSIISAIPRLQWGNELEEWREE